MTVEVLLDIHEELRAIDDANSVTHSLVQALKLVTNSSVRLLTDWGSGAVFGISTVVGPARTAAALLEKELRDQGVTDDIAHLLVHQTQTRMGSTELVYTAVPIKTWRRYQQMAADHPQLVLMYDWIGTLINWAKDRDLSSGTLLVLHPEGLDVLVMEAGRVRALDRLRIFQDGGDDAWGRLGRRAVSLVRDIDSSSAAGVDAALAHPVVLMVCRGGEAFVPSIIQSLSPIIVREVWMETVDLAASYQPNASLLLQRLDWDSLTVSLPLRQAVNPPLDKASAWADRWVAVIGMAAFGLSCIIAITSGVMHYRTQIGFASISGDVQKMQNLWQTLNTDVQQAEQLTVSQKDVRDWVQLRVGSSKVPDMSIVLLRIKNALPSGMVIDEVGLVIEKDTHLVTVVGHAVLIDDSLRSESAFAHALENDGFSLKKRGLLLQDGQPKFKLSMTWSAT